MCFFLKKQHNLWLYFQKHSKSKIFYFINNNTTSTHRKIIDRIDTDKDGYVSHAELHYWIKHRQRRYIEENVNKNWKDYDMNQDGNIGWEEYKNVTYGSYLGNSLVNKYLYVYICQSVYIFIHMFISMYQKVYIC